jgi:hypothetical protein
MSTVEVTGMMALSVGWRKKIRGATVVVTLATLLIGALAVGAAVAVIATVAVTSAAVVIAWVAVTALVSVKDVAVVIAAVDVTALVVASVAVGCGAGVSVGARVGGAAGAWVGGAAGAWVGKGAKVGISVGVASAGLLPPQAVSDAARATALSFMAGWCNFMAGSAEWLLG